MTTDKLLLERQTEAVSAALHNVQSQVDASQLFSTRPYEEASEEMKKKLSLCIAVAWVELEKLAGLLDLWMPYVPQGGYARHQFNSLRNPTGYVLTYCGTYAKNWDEFAAIIATDENWRSRGFAINIDN